MLIKCPACNGVMFSKAKIHPFQICEECGLGQMHPEHLKNRIAILQKENQVETDGARAPVDSDKEHKANAFQNICKSWNAWNGRGDICPPVKGYYCFEIGFGNGHMIEEAIRLGWDVIGCEASWAAVKSAVIRGIPGIHMEFDTEQDEAKNDLVWAWDSFEHMKDLPMAFKNAFRFLDHQGIFVMSSPNLALYQTNKAHPHWLDVSHLWHMTPLAARLLAEKAGFEVLDIKTGRGDVWLDEQYAHPENFVLWGRKR